jgi:pilus assembly protein CpaB
MGLRSIFVTILGISVAGGSAYGAREYLNGARAEATTDPAAAFVTVVVASRDITFGQIITPQLLKTMSWPREALPSEAVTDLSSMLAAPGTPPRRATHQIAQGEIVLVSKVSDFGEKVTIVQSLGANTRAMAIKVDAETAVGGLVTPGDTVDIVMTQGQDALITATTILQNIRVVGVDQDTDETKQSPDVARTVTVEVTPEQGQKLALAQKAGALSLTLRTLDQVEDTPLKQIRLADLFNEERPVDVAAPAAPAAEPVRTTIRVRRANTVALETIN